MWNSRAQNVLTHQEPNTSDNLPSAEIKAHLDSLTDNADRGKTSTKVKQQRQVIMADILGAALLVVVASCTLKIHVKAVVAFGIVGLAW